MPPFSRPRCFQRLMRSIRCLYLLTQRHSAWAMPLSRARLGIWTSASRSGLARRPSSSARLVRSIYGATFMRQHEARLRLRRCRQRSRPACRPVIVQINWRQHSTIPTRGQQAVEMINSISGARESCARPRALPLAPLAPGRSAPRAQPTAHYLRRVAPWRYKDCLPARPEHAHQEWLLGRP
jgi:hypothetical protein